MAQETVDLFCNINFEIDIHPLVIIQILDLHYRKFGASRYEETIVGGAILGTVYTNKVHITECFALLVDPGDELKKYYHIWKKLLQENYFYLVGNEVGDQEFGRKLLSTLNQIDLVRNEQEVLLGQIEEAQLFQQIGNYAQGQALINEKLQKMGCQIFIKKKSIKFQCKLILTI